MIAEGSFVKVLFPTSEQPRRAGPLHIGYCIALVGTDALIAYTSSRPWPAGLALARGVRIFEGAEAAALNQRPFVLYLNRVAKLPLTRQWFPELTEPSREIVAMAPRRLRDELFAASTYLANRHRELIQRLGPGA